MLTGSFLRVIKVVGLSALLAIVAWMDASGSMQSYTLASHHAQSDHAFVATLVLVRRSPHLFSLDYFLGDPDNHLYYSPVVASIVDWGGVLAGDPLRPYNLLGPFVNLVHVGGFFLLGRVLFGNNGSGILLALASLAVCGISGLGSWQPMGLLARGVFNALLPYLLAAAWVWRNTPWTWPLVLGGCGLLVYVHPVSAPAWAPALLLACAAFGGSNWRLKGRWLILATLAFVLLAAQFAVLFTGGKHRVERLSESEHSEFLKARTLRHGVSTLSAPQVAMGIVTGAPDKSPSKAMNLGRKWMLRNAIETGTLPFLLLGAGAFIVGLMRKISRDLVVWTGLLAIGIVFGSIAIPGFVQWVEHKTGTAPFVYEILRGIGYILLLVLILGFIAAKAAGQWLSERTGDPRRSLTWILACQAGFAFLWLFWFPPRGVLYWNHKESPEALREGEDLQDVMVYIRERVPPRNLLVGYQGSRFLPWPPQDLAMFIRLYGRKPVAFCWKDGGVLMVRNPKLYLTWAERYRQARQTLSRPWRDSNDVRGFCVAARSWGAKLWLTTNRVLEEASVSGAFPEEFIRYRNASYALVDLDKVIRSNSGILRPDGNKPR